MRRHSARRTALIMLVIGFVISVLATKFYIEDSYAEIAEAGLTERQNLPVGLSAVAQEIDKPIGVPAHRTDAVRGRQRGNMQHNAAGSFKHNHTQPIILFANELHLHSNSAIIIDRKTVIYLLKTEEISPCACAKRKTWIPVWPTVRPS